DVTDDFRQFDIDLLHGLLHVLDMTGGVAHLHLPLPPVGTQGEYGIRRPKRGTQETVGMQALDPLCVQYVRLRARAATRKLPRFDQVDLEALRLKKLEQRDPVDTGGFQSDRLDAALLQPRDDLLKIGGVGAELADWVGVTVGGDADHMHVGMHIDSGRVRVDDMERRRRGGDGDGKRPLTTSWAWLASWALRLGRPWMSPVRGCGCRNHKVPRAKRGIGDVGSLPNGINTTPGKPGRQVANDKVEASRAKLRCGQDAPKGIRPRTRVTRPQSRDK